MVTVPIVPGQWVERWLSSPRFDKYLTAAGGDRARALELYEWNATISSSILHDLGHVEVGVRNAYNSALVAKQGSRSHWTVDALRYFPPRIRRARDGTRVDWNETPRKQIERARKDAGGPAAPPGKVVAELMFGFWRYMTSANAEHALWTPYLHFAFPVGTKRTDVDGPMGELHDLRNRVAHHEPLLATHLEDRRRDLLRIAELLDSDLHRHVDARSSWATIASQRP